MKSRIGGQMRCIKYFMCLSNTVVFICGLCLVVIGGLGELLYGDIKRISQVGFSSASAIIVIIGCFITIVGLTGCYGSFRENTAVLKVFTWLLVLIMFAELGVGAWIYFAHIKVFTVLKSFLSQVLSRYETDHDIKRLIDKVQTEFSCCGATSYDDWLSSKWNENRQNSSMSIWIDNVPHSCCLKNTTRIPTCGDNLGTSKKPVHEFINTQGCFQYIQNIFMQHVGFSVAIGVSVFILEVMALVSSCCLRHAIKTRINRELGDTVGLVI